MKHAYEKREMHTNFFRKILIETTRKTKA